jgi:superfamily I DNA/RNA helicase
MLQQLNPEQLAAAQHGDGPLLIVAGAGAGKTATLVHRVAHLIERGADPRRILLLTFTRRAAAEMLRRVEAVPAERGRASGGASGRVWGGTFHAVAARLLRIHARDIGMPPDFTIVDRGDAEDLMHVARTALGLGRGGDRFPQKSACLVVYSRCVNAQLPLHEVLHTAFPWCLPAEQGLAKLFARYTDAKEEQRVLDYDDLLLFWRGLLADPAGGARVRERFDHVLVDEFQDTNALQADIVSLLRPDGTGVTCVGDDAQARLRDLEQIEALAARSRTRSEFLAELVLDPPSYTQELAGPPLLDEDYLVLSTMHSAKGLEFDVVFVIHAADGNIPSDMATGSVAEIEEERRLFYVACTRASEQLYVMHPLRCYTQP